jgi:two-component system, OmpR family, response regulator RegX3
VWRCCLVRHNKFVRLLLIEDDDAIAKSVVASLSSAGNDVKRVSSCKEGLESAVTGHFDAILLDLGLPDGDGLDLAKQLRETIVTPIIIVSARGDEVDRIVGLEIGADDYVVKPFSQRELLARIRAVVRRSSNVSAPESRFASRIQIDSRTRTVLVDGAEVNLTPKEFDLLAFLAAEPGVVFRRNEILEVVWDVDWFGTTKTLDAHVAALRKKLGHQGWIEAVRGVGFKFVELEP